MVIDVEHEEPFQWNVIPRDLNLHLRNEMRVIVVVNWIDTVLSVVTEIAQRQ